MIEMKASDYEKAIVECPRNREWIFNRAREIAAARQASEPADEKFCTKCNVFYTERNSDCTNGHTKASEPARGMLVRVPNGVVTGRKFGYIEYDPISGDHVFVEFVPHPLAAAKEDSHER